MIALMEPVLSGNVSESTFGDVRHIHLVGIGGAGMGGIAELLHNLGYNVSGSDIRENEVTNRLRRVGVNIQIGHDPEQVVGSDVVVVSSAIDNSNAEIEAARKLRIPVVPRAEMLAELMRFKYGIAVAGTHGKTTTTSLISSILAEAKKDPTCIIGGLLNSSKSNARLGSGNYLVAEADESDASFLYLQPIISVVTNIDHDHLVAYGGDFEKLKSTFVEFLHHMPFYGHVVACNDDTATRGIIPEITRKVHTYGINYDADIIAKNINQQGARTSFLVREREQNELIHMELNLPGTHNVLNALAAITVARILNIDFADIRNALSGFSGISRRFQVHGTMNVAGKSVLVIDDYGHHPSEISATLKAIRTGYPERRIVLVFQPHRYTRTRDLFDDFIKVLSDADVLLMTEVYRAGEVPIPGADTRTLCRAIRARGVINPVFVDSVDDVLPVLQPVISNDDIIVIMGAGDIGSLVSHIKAECIEGGENK